MIRRTCPICNERKLVDATGPTDADVLLFGAYPGKLEVAKGVPWTGPAGQILENEMARAGIQIRNCRITNLWLHEPAEFGTKRKPNPLYQQELDWHFSQLRKEMAGRKALFIMGAEPCALFGLGQISNLNGMTVMSDLFPSSVRLAVVSVNPAQALHDLLGELRYSIENFAISLQKLEKEQEDE